MAAGVGLLVVPQSLARLHHRRDLTYRPVVDAPQSSVALAWPQEATTDLVDDFIGVVRGRTVNSTRGRSRTTEQSSDGRPPSARQKPAAGASARAGGSRTAKGGRSTPAPGERTAAGVAAAHGAPRAHDAAGPSVASAPHGPLP